MTVVLAHVPDPAAAHAYRAALEQARLRGEPLVVVNVATGDAPVDPRIATEQGLGELTAQAQEQGVPVTVEQPLEADVAAAVLAVADQHAASVLVVGVRRRSAVGKLLLGSVSQRVILEADCPVLGVKAPAE